VCALPGTQKKRTPVRGPQDSEFEERALGFLNMNEFAQATSILKFDDSRYFGKQRIVTANSHVCTRLESGPSLPNDDSASAYKLSGKSFHSKPFGLAVSSVP
jgi:hypothetical protein